MNPCEIEDEWLESLVDYFKAHLPALPLITSRHPLEHDPCLYAEINESVVSFNKLCLKLTFRFSLKTPRESEESLWIQRLRKILIRPFELKGNLSSFREDKITRKTLDKKGREIVLTYQAFVQMGAILDKNP